MTNPGDTSFSASRLEASIEKRDDVSIIHTKGEVDVASAPTLAAYVHLALANAAPLLVINLEAVTFVDSSGLGVLVESQKEAQRTTTGGELRLVISEPRILKVFEVTGLNRAFSIYPSIEIALSAPT